MTALHEQIKKETQDAMRARDDVRLRTLRGLLSAFTNELVANKQKPTEELGDEAVMKVITREAKKRRESIEAFEKGGRSELAEREKEELAVLEVYLPQMMGEDEVRGVVEQKKQELGIDDPSKKGMLMGAVMKELAGRADGTLVKQIVDELLS